METVPKKRNIVQWLICVILVIILIFLGIQGLWFNRKLNRINEETQAKIESTLSGEPPRPGNVVKTISYTFESRISDAIPDHRPTGKYFYHVTSTEADMDFDENNVRILNLEVVNGEEGFTYHPVAIAQYGLRVFNEYMDEKDPERFERAKAQGDYLVSALDAETGKLFYDYDYFIAGSNDETLKAPWASAMAQLQACSLWTRLYGVTKDAKYQRACEEAMRPLLLDVAEGGLARDFNGHVFFEEYPSVKPDYTLNGFIFVLVGLYDVAETFKDETARSLFDAGYDCLVYALPYYDLNGISLYHLAHLSGTKRPLNIDTFYHMLHVDELRVINRIRRNDILSYYIVRWTGYVNG